MRFVLFLLCVLALAACDPGRVYEQKIAIADHTWSKDSALVFSVVVPQAGKPLDVIYHVRHDLDYPYYNLYVLLTVSDTTGKQMLEERQEMQLLDAQTGRPLGSGAGGVYNKDVTALHRVKFDRAGRYIFKVRQYMRLAKLPGIHSIGVRVEESR